MKTKNEVKPSILLFALGFLGVLSTLPLISQFSALRAESLPLSLPVIQVISLVQGSVFLLAMLWLGYIFSRKALLSAPVIVALVNSESALQALKPQLIPALVSGVITGVCLWYYFGQFSTHLPPDFIRATETLTLPWYTKVLYGGITEEILIRWGVMSFLVWVSYRSIQRNGSVIRDYNYVVAIILSSLLFGLLHLPAASAVTSEITPSLILYILLGNATFGFVAGYLYWKHGLECAIIAHSTAHIVMIMLANFS